MRVKYRNQLILPKLAILALVSCIALSLHAQSKLKADIFGMNRDYLVLTAKFGDPGYIVDTIALQNDEHISYEFPADLEKGLYHLYYSEEDYLELILGYGNLSFQIILASPIETMEIQQSRDNKMLYGYYKLRKGQMQEKNALIRFLFEYPHDKPLYDKAYKRLKKLHEKEQDYIQNLNTEAPDAFATRYIRFMFGESFEGLVSKNQKYLEQQYWADKNWTDTLLLNSDAYSSRLIEYLMHYRHRNASREEQEKSYMQACDSIFKHIPHGTAVYDFAFKYLMDGFEVFQMSEVISHMVAEYGGQCTGTSNSLKDRLEFHETFVKGVEVPDIVVPDMSEEIFRLKNTHKEHTLILFWASWCGHCEALLKEMIRLESRFKEAGIAIVTVSLDDSQEDLKSHLKTNPLPWPILCDYKGWKSPVSEAYHIYATPTMILVDADFDIVDKPLNLNQLMKVVNRVEQE